MNFLERVRYVLDAESQAILSIPQETLEVKLPQLATMIVQCTGKVVITGMGKVGHIGKRVAATLSCTGSASVFLDPSASFHGDLGMLSQNDILLALSNSGRTREIVDLVERIRKYFPAVKIAIVTGHPEHTLSQFADISLSYGVIAEPCPLGLTPSASLAVMSALLDALALGVMEERGFTKEQFLVNHNSGYLSSVIRKD